MLRINNKHSAVYRTKSNIENFKFKIKFCSIDSLIKMPKFQTNGSQNEDVSNLRSLRSDMSGNTERKNEDNIEEVEIGWQEKIFSSREVEYYQNVENCTTDVQKVYHNFITNPEFNATTYNIGRIFTYVTDDNFFYEDQLVDGRENRKLPKKLESIEKCKESEVMYVFADLDPETFLFWIKWDVSGVVNVMEIYPDFNDFIDNPYIIEINTDIRYIYKYSIENISPALDVSPRKLTEEILPKFSKLTMNATHSLFDMPPKQKIRVLFLFEVQKGKKFDYENLHVRFIAIKPYSVDVEDGALHGSTHSSKSRKGVWYFGHCFEMSFLVPAEVSYHKNLKVFFEVISIDSWLRERTEGYTTASFTFKPGIQDITLRCFRTYSGLFDATERFFIGGRRKFNFEKFLNVQLKEFIDEIKTADIEKLLNHYGLKTISTGELTIKCTTITQTSSQLLAQTLNSDDYIDKISDLMKAYRTARTRLEASTSKP